MLELTTWRPYEIFGSRQQKMCHCNSGGLVFEFRTGDCLSFQTFFVIFLNVSTLKLGHYLKTGYKSFFLDSSFTQPSSHSTLCNPSSWKSEAKQ
jgi:hypothetical protein